MIQTTNEGEEDLYYSIRTERVMEFHECCFFYYLVVHPQINYFLEWFDSKKVIG